MGPQFSSRMIQLMHTLASSGWLIDGSSLLLMLLFLIIGRWGFVRLASLGLGVILWYVAVRVSLTLTTLILPATPGPSTLT